MNRATILLTLMFLIALFFRPITQGAEAADSDFSKWKYQLSVQVSAAGETGVVELLLPPAVLAKAQSGLGDLRLIKPNGAIVPLVIRVQRGQEKYTPTAEPQKYFNKTFVARKLSSVIVDFGKNQLRNFLDIKTEGNNFRRRVKVEGGNEGVNWQVLTNNGWLFAIPSGQVVQRISRVNLPENNFRYYRITVYNGGLNDLGRINISSVKAAHLVKIPADLDNVPVQSSEVVTDAKHKFTEIRLDLGFENLRLEEVTLDFRERNFLRRCLVFGRNQKTRILRQSLENSLPRETEVKEPWTQITQGSIYRFTTTGGVAESLRLNCRGRYRYLAIRIYNQDDKPLTFVGASVTRLQQRLIFQHQGKQQLRLLLGNPGAALRLFDFGNFVDRLRKDGIHQATLGQLAGNSEYHQTKKEIPWSERNSWLLTFAMITLIMVMGFLVWRQAKQIPQS